MIKSKKQMFIVIGMFALFLFLGSTTYAFFNYTRTGSPNNFSVGRIYFKSDNEETITLSNLFPIDPLNATDMADPTKVGTYSIDITGDTDYVDGLEYLVSIVDSNITVPISVDVSVSNGLGTSSDNYFDARESKDATIYKKLAGDTITGDGILLVGYVKPNTTSGVIEGVDGTITITAYLDKNKILISDTYDGTESDDMGTTNAQAEGKTVISTDDWNILSTNGLSFKVKVEANEGIWVIGTLEDIMKRNAVMDNIQSTYVSASTGIDFGIASSDTNGKGVYIRSGTENDPNPIYYYRGLVEDNNVLFNNMCWKAFRTTDTGGVKLLYNGIRSNYYSYEYEDSDTYESENVGDTFTFDTTDNTWNYEVSDEANHMLMFKVPAGENYNLVVTGTTGSNCASYIGVFKNNEYLNNYSNGGGAPISFSNSIETLTASDSVKVIINGSSASSTCRCNLKISMEQNSTKLSKNSYNLITKKDTGELGCFNFGEDSFIEVNGSKTSEYNITRTDEYNSVYATFAVPPVYVGYMYGDVYLPYIDHDTVGEYFGSGFTYENGVYSLTNPSTTIDFTHHYTCNLATPDGTCEEIRYIHYSFPTYDSYSDYHYISLSGGDGVEDALEKMFSNKTNSTVKTQVDTWYASNMTNVTNKLEDTIWCNDRKYKYLNGWDPNGGNLNNLPFFSSRERSGDATDDSERSKPSLICANKNDSFTVNNEKGNGDLTYPVALINSDEIQLSASALVSFNDYQGNGSMTPYWSMSPFSETDMFGQYMPNGYYHFTIRGELGIRPAISIKPGQLIRSGTGTVLDPYVIE